ncbi:MULTISPECIES: hypothetical protein [Deinococcus]|uniref:hypothetical protein n=1 Tax=Deinococcus TaxID=1298 RepID=UPI0004D54D40|nr:MULTISPECIES: hypothetical protein [Deinococcus]KEF33951.1 hypothetical protein RDMS_09675 [Deinococcus sp. RL]
MKNMHVPLPDHVHQALMAHAKAMGESATSLARGAIEQLVRELEHERIRAEMRAFAEEYAGTAWDLDPELEEAGLEVLRRTP